MDRPGAVGTPAEGAGAALSQLSRTGTIDALIGSHVKVTFDRSSVEFDAQAGSDALTPLRLRDRHDFRNPAVVDHDRGIRDRERERHAAETLGSWRGPGVWTGRQTYAFEDSWSYPAGVYGLTMTYTLSTP